MTDIRVVAAAVLYKGLVHCLPPPARHHDILAKMHTNGMRKPFRDQGFVLSDGRFCHREEAACIALKNGQITKLTAPPKLYSEDLW